MENYNIVPIESDSMKTYLFKIVLEQDEDFDGNASGWLATCPTLVEKGASAWGETQEEAVKNLREVLEMTLEGLIEAGEAIPHKGNDDIEVLEEPRVAVTL